MMMRMMRMMMVMMMMAMMMIVDHGGGGSVTPDSNRVPCTSCKAQSCIQHELQIHLLTRNTLCWDG